MMLKNFTLVCSVVLALGVGASAFAEDGVIKQDDQRIGQDKGNLKETNQDIKNADQGMAADKADGNKAQMKKDKEAKKEADKAKKEEKKRLKQDRKEKAHDEKHP